jgi:LCP family protein required for cell wall assembly
MKRKIWIVLGSMVVLIGLSISILLFHNWNRPLGVALGLPTRTVVSEDLPDSPDINPTDNDKPPSSEGTLASPTQILQQDIPTVTPSTPEPVCGGPPLMYILGVGVDTRDPKYLYGLGDVIRIARIDFTKPKVTVLTLPRDLWVAFPEITEKYADTVTHGKLNQAYLYGGPGMGYYEGPGGGPGLLARTIAYNYGLYVDHYGAVNMAAFVDIVDALGGIDITLDQDWDGRPVDENTVDLGYFTAGEQHMSGEEALRFARIRKLYSEVARTDNQSLVICAIKDKLLTPSVVSKIPKLINALIGEIQTDLSPAQIQQLACVLPKLGEGDLQFVRFPDEMMVQGRIYDPVMGGRVFIWDIPLEDIQAFIRDFENDAIPNDSDGEMICP